MANGTLHYKVVNGKVDPNSLRGEREYNGNHKVDDEFAQTWSTVVLDHEDVPKALEEDYDFESDRMRSKFGMEDAEDNAFNNKEETVEDFVQKFFDYTSNQFPKGETAVLTSVEKKFETHPIKTAQETIAKLMNNKDPEIAQN